MDKDRLAKVLLTLSEEKYYAENDKIINGLKYLGITGVELVFCTLRDTSDIISLIGEKLNNHEKNALKDSYRVAKYVIDNDLEDEYINHLITGTIADYRHKIKYASMNI